MRTLLKGLLTVSPLTFIGVASLIIQTKVLAVVLGPEGSGFFFLGASFVAAISTIAAVGVGSSLMKLVSEFSGTGRTDRIWETTVLGLATATLTSVAVATALLVSSGLFANLFLGSSSISHSDREFFFLVAAAGAVPITWSAALTGALRGFRNLKTYVVCGCITTVLVPGAIVIGAVASGARAALVGGIIGYVLSVFVFLVFAAVLSRSEQVPFRLPTRWSIAKSLERRLLYLGVFALVATLAGSVGQTLIRADIARSLDLRAVGFFAAAWSLSNRLPILIYQTFGMYISPRISSLGADWKAVVEEQNNALRVGLLAATPIICLMIAAAELVVDLLLSPQFRPMVHLAQIMFVGELLSVVAYSVGVGLYASGRALQSAGNEWVFWAVFLGSAFIALRTRGLTAVGFAYIIAYACQLCWLYAYEWRHHGFRWSRQNLWLFAASVTAATVTAVISVAADLPVAVRLLCTVALLGGWAAASLTRSERRHLRRALGRVRAALA